MSSDSHDDIRDFLEQAAAGDIPSGRRLVFNPATGKFEVRSSTEQPADVVPQVSAEDMRAFGVKADHLDDR